MDNDRPYSMRSKSCPYCVRASESILKLRMTLMDIKKEDNKIEVHRLIDEVLDETIPPKHDA